MSGIQRRAGTSSVLALLIICGSAAPVHAAPADELIRDLRLQYNRTIALRDAAGFSRFLMPSFAELVSTGEVTTGAEAVAESYARTEFKDPTFVAYDRRPDTIEVSADGRLAVERGHWTGRFRRSGAETATGCGLYQAGWVWTDAGWRIQTEAYVGLGCAKKAKR